jgi:hypothetical protein
VPDETRIDVQRLRDIAGSVGALLGEHQEHFTALDRYAPDFGDFDAARWLGDLITDHRDAVLAHLAYLRRTLTDVHAALEQIATDVQEADAANAAALGRADGRDR